jgi:hypothetical protein
MNSKQTFKRIVLNDNLEQVVVDTPYYREIIIEGYPAHVHKQDDWWEVSMAGLRIGEPRKTSKLAEESARANVAIHRQHLEEAYNKGMDLIKQLTQP